jgi:hypothetical protein
MVKITKEGISENNQSAYYGWYALPIEQSNTASHIESIFKPSAIPKRTMEEWLGRDWSIKGAFTPNAVYPATAR